MSSKDPKLVRSWDLFVTYMHDCLERGGVRVLVTDGDGKQSVQLVDFPAAYISAFERWLHHSGMTGAKPADVAKGGNDMAAQVARLRGKGVLGRIGQPPPPVSEGHDAATG